jgi:hypothetical protein
MIPYSQHPFPLYGVVAFAGSRHGSLFVVPPVISAVLSSGDSVRWLRRRPWFDPVICYGCSGY